MSLTAAVQTRGRFVALCDHCTSPIPFELDATSLSAAHEQLAQRGWLLGALRSGEERWGWFCPACNPVRFTRKRAPGQT
jgi:hypothetical protein